MSYKLFPLIFVFLLLLSWSIRAYNVHKTLSSPKDVLKLLDDNKDTQLIAVYVKDNSLGLVWEIASYDSKNCTLKVTTIRALTFPYPRIKTTSKVIKTPYNYSKISTNYRQITTWPKKTPALFFAGKWYTPKNFSTGNLPLNGTQEYRSIYAFYSKADLWIGEVEIRASPDAGFGRFSPGKAIVPLLSTEGKATNFFYISNINLGDFLVLPDLPGNHNPTVWRIEEKNGNTSKLTLIYPGGTKIDGVEISGTPYQCEFRLDKNLTSQLMKVIIDIGKFNAIHAAVGFFKPCNASELKWAIVIDSKKGGVVTGGNLTPQRVTWR